MSVANYKLILSVIRGRGAAQTACFLPALLRVDGPGCLSAEENGSPAQTRRKGPSCLKQHSSICITQRLLWSSLGTLIQRRAGK